MSVLGNISPQQFLAEYWQQKPLVVRGAFADLEVPFTPEELAGLAVDTNAPSRIIVEHGLPPENSPWQAKHSPFTDEDFTSLPDTHWTFLINDLERYVPELGNLIEPFRFIPDWRIDDLMVSYAADQGSVGPHRDDYDVFLIQGMGKRRWKIITRDDYPRATIPDISLSILSEFKADQEWLLEPGDMLYLPPNMPHYGIAEGECMTFSVGFRAPSKQELIQGWVESFTDRPEFKQRFTDKNRKLQNSSGEINQKDLQALSSMIMDSIQTQQHHLGIWLGKYLTETRGDVLTSEQTQQTFQPDTDYERESWLRFSYIDNNSDADAETKSAQNATIHFFADGKHIELPVTMKKTLQMLCSDYFYTADSLIEIMKHQPFKSLFELLISEGGLYPAEL
jgi:50S ribosomal protein L16 3-hydroxylase